MKRKLRQIQSGISPGNAPLRQDPPRVSRWYVELLVFLLLSFLTVAAYWQVLRCDFVKYDDPEYITQNAKAMAGLTWPGFVWAFSTFHAGNWHPLTWLSHMLDCQLYGLEPAGHHLTNLLLHVANTLLLLVVLRRMTGALWRSAFVAALFALHPLHVESVAWISERKDLLSTLFFLLTLWCYVRYTQMKTEGAAPSSGHLPSYVFYLLALVCFILSLMSKPMFVTLPFALLLLDYWPLKRFQLSTFNIQRSTFWRLMFEKLPFLAFSAGSSLITIRAQQSGGAVVPTDAVSVINRLGNALISYSRYLRKTVWPDDLAVFYPYPLPPPFWQVIGAGLLLAVVSILAVILIRRRPYLLIGWLWYLGTLVPTIGLVQVGGQSMADRYSYVPLIGVFIMLAWLAGDFAAGRPRQVWVVRFAAIIALAACLGTTSGQLQHWRNTEQLFTHALRVTKDNYILHAIWGGVLHKQGRLDEAIAQYQASLRLHPGNAEIQDSLGCALLELGKPEEAIPHMQQAIQIKPDLASAHNDLGQALARQGRMAEAMEHYETAVRLDPELPDPHNNLANVLFDQKKYAEAESHYRAALRLKPDFVPALHNLGLALAALGRIEEAAAEYSTVLKIEPNYVPTQYALAELLLKQGRNSEAIKWFASLTRNQPENAEAHYRLGVLLAAEGQTGEAIRHLQEAVRLRPDGVPALNELAWKLATRPEAQFREGDRAVELATRAVQLTRTNNAAVLDTLAAAYAEAGRLDEAAKVAHKAMSIAQAAGQNGLVSQIQERLKLYQSNRPYRE